MEHRPDTVDPAALAPPYRALFEGLRAEVAALAERNRELERREPEAVVEGLRTRVVLYRTLSRQVFPNCADRISHIAPVSSDAMSWVRHRVKPLRGSYASLRPSG